MSCISTKKFKPSRFVNNSMGYTLDFVNVFNRIGHKIAILVLNIRGTLHNNKIVNTAQVGLKFFDTHVRKKLNS